MESFHFTGYYKTPQSVITIYDKMTMKWSPSTSQVITKHHRVLLQFTTARIITLNDSMFLQFTKLFITFHDRY